MSQSVIEFKKKIRERKFIKSFLVSLIQREAWDISTNWVVYMEIKYYLQNSSLLRLFRKFFAHDESSVIRLLQNLVEVVPLLWYPNLNAII